MFLCVCLLLQQAAPSFASGLEGRRPPRAYKAAAGVDFPAKTDYLGNQLNREIQNQIGEGQGLLLRAGRLDAKARKALLDGDAAQFYLAEKDLNALLFSMSSNPASDIRLYALEHLAANIKEGLIDPKDANKVFSALERFLRGQKTCGGKFCDVVGLSVLTLALSVHAAADASFASLNLETPPIAPQENKRRALNGLYTSLMARDYGSVQANNAVASYVLRALGYTGGAQAVTRAAKQLIAQSQNISVLWGAAAIPTKGTGWHLNKYDVPNAPAQKAAMQVLASLGEEGKSALEYFAAQNHSLPSYTHANIELAYLGSARVPVPENIYNLYCVRKWDLDAQKDFALRQELGYAYGRGRAPAYITPSGDYSCKVAVPLRPDPRLEVKAWTDAIGAEVLFNAAFIGAGSLFKILRHAKNLRVYANTHHGMSLREFYQAGKRLPRFGFRAELEAAAKPQSVTTVLVKTKQPKPSARATSARSDFLDETISVSQLKNQYRAEISDLLAKTSQNPGLNPAQRAHIARLERRMEQTPTSYVFGEIKRDLQTLPRRKENALLIYGSDVETDEVLIKELRRNFMADPIGLKRDGALFTFGQDKSQLFYELENYGKMSPDVFIRWDTHGGPRYLNRPGVWFSTLNDTSAVSMAEISAAMQKLMASGSAQRVTLFLDSCFPGMAFDNFLALPAAARKNINLFALGGFRQNNYVLHAPLILRAPLSPLQYARTLWREGLEFHTLAGRAFVNGRVVSPLDDAIKNARLLRPSAASELEAYRALAQAKTPKELRQAFYTFQQKVKHPHFRNTGNFMDDYSLVPLKDYALTQGVTEQNLIYFPKHLAEEVGAALDKTVF